VCKDACTNDIDRRR